MKRSLLVSVLITAILQNPQGISAATNNVVRSAAELDAALKEERIGARFDITATVTYPCNSICCTFAVEDASGAVVLREDAFFPKCPMKAGDRVRITGSTFKYMESGSVAASDNKAHIISHGPPPTPVETSIPELLEGRHVNRLVRLCGTVRDAFVDEIDPLWGYLVLQDAGRTFYATCASPSPDVRALNALVGARIRLTGLYNPYIVGSRRTGGLQMLFSGLDAIDIVQPAPANPFDVPLLGSERELREAIVTGMGRRRAVGRVVAVWHGDRMLLRTSDGRTVRVDLQERNPPEFGAVIECVGIPETDLYRFNLSRAVWRPASPEEAILQESEPEGISASQLLTDRNGVPAVQVRYHGKPVRITGIVRSLPAPNHPYDRLGLECDRIIVPVDASACPAAFDGVEIGCIVEVSGVCLIETENWRPNAPFPHVEGVAVVVRTPADVRIVSRPPWWTPERLLSVIGALLAAIAGIFAWNRSLNRLAERRGRELTAETLARATSEMKVGERTRLAVELHDSLSQNLTGVSLEVATAAKLATRDTAKTLHHLDIAEKSLKSCRDELRNCIWDLRNYALDEKDMDGAVRRTLAPFVDGVALVVRFNVPRETLPDNTVHSLLRIIRELVQNAIGHGHAKTIRIAGCVDGDALLFSVEDDGCGFDPDRRPGVRDGHFGLQGIRERMNRFGGKMTIESEIGRGSKISISLGLPQKS